MHRRDYDASTSVVQNTQVGMILGKKEQMTAAKLLFSCFHIQVLRTKYC